MPKGKTGKPRGRPRGIRNLETLSEEALFLALSAVSELASQSVPTAHLAKLLAAPHSLIVQYEQEHRIFASIEPPSSWGEEQLRNRLHYAAQRRNGSHGPPYLQDEREFKFILEGAHVVFHMLVAEHFYKIEFLSKCLENEQWNKRVIDRVRAMALLRLSGRRLNVA